jgi:hypothetical protein
MARKDKRLPSFGEVANNDVNNNNNDYNNVDENLEEGPPSDNKEVVSEPRGEESTLDKIINKPKSKKSIKNYDKVLVGFHVERHLAAILDDLQGKGGKGVKSQIINELLEKAFKEKGLL